MMTRIKQDCTQQLNGFFNTTTTSINNQLRTPENNRTSNKSSRKKLHSIENKLDVVEKIIKFLSNDE